MFDKFKQYLKYVKKKRMILSTYFKSIEFWNNLLFQLYPNKMG
jgi:hypothetical protein